MSAVDRFLTRIRQREGDFSLLKFLTYFFVIFYLFDETLNRVNCRITTFCFFIPLQMDWKFEKQPTNTRNMTHNHTHTQ